MKKNTLALALFVACTGATGTVTAAPYQFEVAGLYFTTKLSFTFANGQTQSEKSTSTGGEAIYFLQPVKANRGPLAERAFLSKSASVTGRFLKNEFDSLELTELNSDARGISARFVTQSDLIVDLDYTTTEFDGAAEDSDPDMTIGIGRYLDDVTTTVVSYNDAGDDVKILSADYRKVVNGAARGVYMAYDAGLSYVDVPDDSGYVLNFAGKYYFSQFASIGAGYSISKVGDSDENILTFGADYFFNESVYGSVNYSKFDLGDDFETTLTAFRLGARF